ncbi:uncharacterized protein LOC130629293 isoform X2 [Hydractinia symbiolongicarpus]|uniref:uncharacterized protein LOC130629293 isoform X2 n=1 Tax=Hydractinia symbiolongicarpus TaxID=13093 RepID=UPI00254CB733|nr:uncharacterized protein LOC130629293 isoform X2 [Hydractinia symbiolongicarpus]XP_057298430.1 uncharacterized protein LOC130629293 isoform X2 [Hydractinia symbiolongicarpus]
MASRYFFSILTDGSQARKTGNDKGMVLTRTEKNGIPMYFVALLLEMSDWGGTDAALLKNGIDSIFMEHGSIHLDPNTYTNKFVGCISDGASINFRATRTGCFNYL